MQYLRIVKFRAWQLPQVTYRSSGLCRVIHTCAGYPIATMPLGIIDDIGRPFGLAIMAKAGREDLLFQFLSAFEENFPRREIPPQLAHREKVGTVAPKI